MAQDRAEFIRKWAKELNAEKTETKERIAMSNSLREMGLGSGMQALHDQVGSIIKSNPIHAYNYLTTDSYEADEVANSETPEEVGYTPTTGEESMTDSVVVSDNAPKPQELRGNYLRAKILGNYADADTMTSGFKERAIDVANSLVTQLPEGKNGGYLIGGYEYSKPEATNIMFGVVENTAHPALWKNATYRDEWLWKNEGKGWKHYLEDKYNQWEDAIANIEALIDKQVGEDGTYLGNGVATRMGAPFMATTANYESAGGAKLREVKDLLKSIKKDNLWRGIDEGFNVVDMATMGLNSFFAEIDMARILGKAMEGEELTSREKVYYDLWSLQQDMEQTRELKGRSIWNSIGESLGTTAEMTPSFYLGMAGISSALPKIALKAVPIYAIGRMTKTAAKKGVMSAMKTAVGGTLKAGGRMAANIAKAEVAGLIASPFLPSTWGTIAEKRGDQYSMENGRLAYKPKAMWKDVLSGWTEMSNELASEFVGVRIAKMIGGSAFNLGRLLGIDKLAKKIGISSQASHLLGWKKPEALRVLQRNLGYAGPIAEPLSEVWGDVAANLMKSAYEEGNFRQFKDKDYWLTTLGVSAIYGGSVALATSPIAIKDYLNSSVHQTGKMRKTFLGKIKDKVLRDKVLSITALNDIEAMSSELAHIDWNAYNNVDIAYAMDFIRADMSYKVQLGDAKESIRQQQYENVVLGASMLSYRGKRGDDATNTQVIVEDTDGTQYYVLSGDINAEGEEMLDCVNLEGKRVPLHISKVAKKSFVSFDDVLAEGYKQMFGVQIEQERQQDIIRDYYDMDLALADDIARLMQSFGSTKRETGETVNLTDGKVGVVEQFNADSGTYLVTLADGMTVSVPFYDILEEDALVAEAQSLNYSQRVLNEVEREIDAEEQEEEVIDEDLELDAWVASELEGEGVEGFKKGDTVATPNGNPARVVSISREGKVVVDENMGNTDGRMANAYIAEYDSAELSPYTENVTPITPTISEVEESVPVETTKEAVEEPKAMEEIQVIPRTEDGAVDYNSISEPKVYSELYSQDVGDRETAVADVVSMRDNARADIEKKSAEVQKANNANDKMRLRKEVKALEERMRFYDDVLTHLAPEGSVVEVAPTPENIEPAPMNDSIPASTQPEQKGIVHNEWSEHLTEEEYRITDIMAKNLGLQIVFVKEIVEPDGTRANARIFGNKVEVAWVDRKGTIPFLIGHEFTHRMRDLSPEMYGEVLASVENFLGPNEWSRRERAMRNRYRSVGMSISEASIAEEVIADFVGEMVEKHSIFNGYVESNSNNPKLLQFIADIFKAIRDFFRDEKAVTEEKRLDDMLNTLDKFISSAIEKAQATRVDETDKGSIRHSLSTPSLVGVHNISLDKLRKVIKMGGLANPSVAVIDVDKQTHDDYGEYSLVLPKNMVDARQGKNAGTWAGDAWTPTYPSIIKRMSDNKSYSRFHKDIEALPEAMRNRVRLDFDSFMEGRSANALAYWYLFEKGSAPELVLVPSRYSDDITNAVSEATKGSFSMYGLTPEERAKCVDAYIAAKFNGDRAAFEQEMQERIGRLTETLETKKSDRVKKWAQDTIDAIKEYGFDYDAVADFIRDVEYDAREKGTVNDSATTIAAREQIKASNLEADYEAWLNSLEVRYGIDEYIFDGYTNSGNRRYLPHTLENVSKWMKKQGRQGAVATFPSFGVFIATAIPKMTSLESIRKRKALLGKSKEEYDAFREKWENVYYELGKRLQPDAKGFDDYGYWRLIEAVGKNNPKEFIKKEYGIELSEEDMAMFNDMVNAIRTEYPARYFETKFERPLQLSDFTAAVVPNDIPLEVESRLKDAGVEVIEYEKGDNASRAEAMQKASAMEGVRFSLIGEVGASALDMAEEATFRMDNLAIARQMEERGDSALDIRMATGWERGADGLWRYELMDYVTPKTFTNLTGKGKETILAERNAERKALEQRINNLGTIMKMEYAPDMFSKLYWPKEVAEKIQAIADEYKGDKKRMMADFEEAMQRVFRMYAYGDTTFMLEEVIGKDHEIFKAYPELKDVSVEIEKNNGQDYGGNYNPKTKRIKIVDYKDRGKYEAGAIVHEIQHAIQYIEGFTTGINPKTELPLTEGQKKSLEVIREMTSFVDLYKDNLADAIEESVEYGNPIWDNLSQHAKTMLKYFGRRMRDGQTIDYVSESLKNMHESASVNLVGKERYHRQAGEVEARNVSARLNMSAEERRNTLLSETEDVAREDQIFLRDGVEMAMAEVEVSDDAERLREQRYIDEVNAQYNARLLELNENRDAKKRVLHLGRPQKFLRDAGIVDTEIEMEFDKFIRKSSDNYKHDHPFTAEDILDLPKAINAPIAVFKSTNGVDKVILTEIKKDGMNFIVTIKAVERKRKGGVILEVNEIETLYPKKSKGIVSWINKELASNVDKEKALAWVEALRTNRETELTEQELNAATKIIKDFPNPKISEKFSLITPEMDAAYLSAVERGDMDTAQQMVMEAAKLTGYVSPTDYQGSLAFNGAAPMTNDYFETKEERKEAWDNGDYEGTMSLGDYADNAIDTNDLKWQLTDKGNYRRAEDYTKESIDNINESIKNGTHKIVIYRAVPNAVEENAVRNGDWVTPSRKYAEFHIGLQDWGGGRVIEQEVDIDNIWWNGDDINEWGYDDGSNYGYRNTPNNRKLLDPVTYDDAGNVIPLSERFNPEKEDIRYSLMQPTDEEVTFDNFFQSTSAVFEAMPKSEVPQREPDYVSERWDGFGVSSRYWYGEDERGKYVIRESNHWSSYPQGERTRAAFEAEPYNKRYTRIASCRWALAVSKEQVTTDKEAYLDGDKMYGKAYLDEFTKWEDNSVRYSIYDNDDSDIEIEDVGDEGIGSTTEDQILIYLKHKHYARVKEIRDRFKQLRDIARTDLKNRQAERRAYIESMYTNSARIDYILGDSEESALPLAHQALVRIARGEIRIKWADSADGKKKGLASELGYKDAERRLYSSITKDATLYFDEAVHEWWQMIDGYTKEIDTQDLRNALIEVLGEVASPKGALSKLREIYDRDEVQYDDTMDVYEQELEKELAEEKARYEAEVADFEGNKAMYVREYEERTSFFNDIAVVGGTIAEVRKTIDQMKAKANKRVVRVKSQFLEWREGVEAVKKAVKETITSSNLQSFQRNELRRILDKVDSARSLNEVDALLVEIDNILQDVAIRKQRMDMDRMLKVRLPDGESLEAWVQSQVQEGLMSVSEGRKVVEDLWKGRNASGVSVASRVDEETKNTLEKLRKLISPTAYSQKVEDANAEERGKKVCVDKELSLGESAITANDKRIQELEDKRQMDPEKYTSDDESEYVARCIYAAYLDAVMCKQEVQIVLEGMAETEMTYYGMEDQKETKRILLEVQMDDLVEAKKTYLKALEGLNNDLLALLREGRDKLQLIRKVERAHKERILRLGYNALRVDTRIIGQPTTAMQKVKATARGLVNAPYWTFQTVCKEIDHLAPNGEGNFYNHFMYGLQNCVDIYYKQYSAHIDEVGRNLATALGRKYNNAAHFIADVIEESDRKIVATITYGKGLNKDGQVIEPERYNLTISNAMYLLAMYRQPMYRGTLNKRGIDDRVMDALQEALNKENEGLIKFMDWVNNTFLPDTRLLFNDVHKQMFGVSMAEEKNYFPARVVGFEEKQDISLNETGALPSTITKSIIQRIRNGRMVDLRQNYFKVLMGHLMDMNNWSAFAPMIRDLNILVSDNRFRNMCNTLQPGNNADGGGYGSLFQAFKTTSAIAVNCYRPRKALGDELVTTILKGWAGSKIAFRLNTALKQFASSPVFLVYMLDKECAKEYTSSWWYTLAHGKELLNWMKEVSPSFKKRVDSKFAGMDVFERKTGEENGFGVYSEWKASKIGSAVNNLDNLVKRFAVDVGMAPNAAIDALVVMSGFKAVYEYEIKRMMKGTGLEQPTEEMKKKAIIKAEVAFNSTQQSAESLYLSQIQADRSYLTNVLTVFLNSSFGYHRLRWGGYKELARLNYDQTYRAVLKAEYGDKFEEVVKDARKKARSQIMQGILGDLVFAMTGGFGTLSMFTMFGGGDDDGEVWESFKQSLFVGLVNTTMGGFAGGTILANAIQGYDISLDTQFEELVRDLKWYGKLLKGEENLFAAIGHTLNLIAKYRYGMDFKTFENMAIGVQNLFDGSGANEAIMKILNAPESQILTIAGRRREGETSIQYVDRIRSMETMWKTKDDKREKELLRQYNEAKRKDIVSKYGGNAEWRRQQRLEEEYEKVVTDLGWSPNARPNTKAWETGVFKSPVEGIGEKEFIDMCGIGASIAGKERFIDKFVGQEAEYYDLIQQSMELKEQLKDKYNESKQ